MTPYNQPDQHINQTLNSLDGISRATANPFLYTRIMAKLRQQQNPWEKAARFIARPAFAVLLIAFALFINLWVAVKNNDAKAMAKSTIVQPEQDFAAEFSTVNYAFTETNNTK